jgi:hypothetical protein
VKSGAEGLARGVRCAALGIEQLVDAVHAVLAQVDHVLVVGVRDRHPGHALLLVHLLLGIENCLQEKVLELLVRKVDAQLLEGVDLEELEAVHVEQPDVPEDGRNQSSSALISGHQ